MLATLAMASYGGYGLTPPNSINFNLRRDNDNNALESANKKIQLEREQNKKKKLDRAANKV